LKVYFKYSFYNTTRCGKEFRRAGGAGDSAYGGGYGASGDAADDGPGPKIEEVD
jgi:hypothetical protein